MLRMRLRFIIIKNMPQKSYTWLKRIYWAICFFWYCGNKVTCTICRWHFRKFLPMKGKPNSQCPRCLSIARHRLLWLYLKEKMNFFTDHLKVIYIAPMYFLQQKFQKMVNLEYISADISSSTAMVKMDITNIKFPDNQFDCIICNHVLEHVGDDRKTLKELFKVLKPDNYVKELPDDTIQKYRLAKNETIYFCTKPLKND